MWWTTTTPGTEPAPTGRVKYASTGSPPWPSIDTTSEQISCAIDVSPFGTAIGPIARPLTAGQVAAVYSRLGATIGRQSRIIGVVGVPRSRCSMVSDAWEADPSYRFARNTTPRPRPCSLLKAAIEILYACPTSRPLRVAERVAAEKSHSRGPTPGVVAMTR